MMLSELIEKLTKAHLICGDVPVQELDSESGDWLPIRQVIKIYPPNERNRSPNSEMPVTGIGVLSCRLSFDNVVE